MDISIRVLIFVPTLRSCLIFLFRYAMFAMNVMPSSVRNAERCVASVFVGSMGGHGALISFLKNPGLYKSVSAFAPICHPVDCPWGNKAFLGYLGSDRASWEVSKKIFNPFRS